MTTRSLFQLLPNFISLARLLAVPVTVYLILQDTYDVAFWLFVAAGVSDALDGYLAKRFNLESVLGSYLDPLADKALLVGVFIALGVMEHVAMWLVILIVFRDLLIVGGAILFHTLTQSLQMQPLLISKLNTVAQILLACAVLAQLGANWELPWLTESLIVAVAATTFLSGAAYVIKWGRMAILMEQDK